MFSSLKMSKGFCGSWCFCFVFFFCEKQSRWVFKVSDPCPRWWKRIFRKLELLWQRNELWCHASNNITMSYTLCKKLICIAKICEVRFHWHFVAVAFICMCIATLKGFCSAFQASLINQTYPTENSLSGDLLYNVQFYYHFFGTIKPLWCLFPWFLTFHSLPLIDKV